MSKGYLIDILVTLHPEKSLLPKDYYSSSYFKGNAREIVSNFWDSKRMILGTFHKNGSHSELCRIRILEDTQNSQSSKISRLYSHENFPIQS